MLLVRYHRSDLIVQEIPRAHEAFCSGAVQNTLLRGGQQYSETAYKVCNFELLPNFTYNPSSFLNWNDEVPQLSR